MEHFSGSSTHGTFCHYCGFQFAKNPGARAFRLAESYAGVRYAHCTYKDPSAQKLGECERESSDQGDEFPQFGGEAYAGLHSSLMYRGYSWVTE